MYKWTPEKIKFVKDNWERYNDLWLAEQLETTIHIVKRLRVNEGFVNYRRWTKEQNELLEELWGSARPTIMAAFPDFSWGKIRAHAIVELGLPTLDVAKDAIYLNLISETTNYRMKNFKKWKELHGFKWSVEKVKGSKPKKQYYFVDLQFFWEWVLKNSTVFDIHRVKAGDLGVEPPEIKELRKTVKPHKRKIPPRTDAQRLSLAKQYLQSDLTAKQFAERHNTNEHTIKGMVRAMKLKGLIPVDATKFDKES